MSNPFDELLKGMSAQPNGQINDTPNWRYKMQHVIDSLDDSDTALLIVCINGRTRLIKSINGTASEMIEKAIAARPKMNMK